MKQLLFILALACVAGAANAAGRPHVLFVAVDDLRPQLGCYGKSFMHTPNLNRLAARGVLFERAYCMVPTCGASRASLLTGLRPARDRFVNYLTWAEKDAPGVTTLNTHFKNHGYTTISLGKVFHHAADHADGWSEKPWRPRGSGYQNGDALERAIAESRKMYPNKRQHRGPAFESAEAPDAAYPDGQVAAKAIEYLQQFAKNPRQPFFLAVGFYKPHLPFTAPKKYWDLYDFDQVQLPENDHPPQGAPPGAVHNSGELRSYAGIPPRGPVGEATARRLIHGYYACVSFTDAQVGRVLDELDRSQLAKDTLVILWGDHGWQLGEHGMWNKHSCFETSMHAPLLMAAPMFADIQGGSRVAALTEFIDIYPTLCELTGLPVPNHVQGTSLMPWLKDPSRPGQPFAIGRFQAGDTIRTDQFRFTEYTAQDGSLRGRMLYDHRRDPGENVNVAEALGVDARRLADWLRAEKGK